MALRARRLALLAALLSVVALALAPLAQAHHGPPKNRFWHRCDGTVVYRGDSHHTVNGVVRAARNTATQYFVRIRPALPFGWSGSANPRGARHAPVWVPAGTTHWFPSPAIFTSPLKGSFAIRVDVRPGPGVFNAYGVEIWAAYPCRYWG